MTDRMVVLLVLSFRQCVVGERRVLNVFLRPQVQQPYCKADWQQLEPVNGSFRQSVLSLFVEQLIFELNQVGLQVCCQPHHWSAMAKRAAGAQTARDAHIDQVFAGKLRHDLFWPDTLSRCDRRLAWSGAAGCFGSCSRK